MVSLSDERRPSESTRGLLGSASVPISSRHDYPSSAVVGIIGDRAPGVFGVSTIVGRESEQQLIGGFLAAIGSSARALHLHGDAGMGKSTLLHHALTAAAEHGYRVLSTRPTEAEARLPFAGLNDLVGSLFDETADQLPEPQRRSLDAALMRSSTDDAGLDPLAISLGVLAVLRATAERQPLLLAIDDTPWLDDSSASALEFAIRRLDLERIGVVAAERTSPDATVRRRLIAEVAPDRVTEIRVTPLSLADTDRLLTATLGLRLPPSTLGRLHAVTGGNPFYAVEIGRAIERRGPPTVAEGLPVPDTLSELLRDRLDALAPAAADAVEVASALSQPTVPVLDLVLGSETVAAGLEEAIAAAVVTVDGEAIRFTHPLLAAELYAGLGDSRRRELHRRLAEAVDTPEERARHVALAADGPDESVAAELEHAAERAYSRGAADGAAELIERALPLTPDAPERLRRLRLAARYHLRAGDIANARQRLEQALEQAPAGDARAGILLRLGEVRDLMDDWGAGEAMFDQALREVRDDVRLEIEIRLQLAGVSHITGRNWEAGAAHVTEAMRLAEELADPEVLVRTIGPYVTWSRLTGVDYPTELEARAEELEPWTGNLRTMDHPAFDIAHAYWVAGDVVGFRRRYELLLERAERVGDYSSLPFLLSNMVHPDFLAGRSDVAAARLDRAERLARATGQRTALGAVLSNRTYLHARLGDADEAWKAGRELFDLVAETGWIQGEPGARRELARLELSRRDPEAALAALGPRASMPATDVPWVLWKDAIHVEALIGVGRLAEARDVLDGIERHAPYRESAMRMRYHTVAKALLEAAAGNVEDASRLVASAATLFDAASHPWGMARVALVAGEIHRRARRRAAARASLLAAVEGFEWLGAKLWARYAREQLDRIGGAREDEHGLTATQLQVAELVVGGLTNREVAERLLMSPHTVEAHLTAIYRTLDIRSRVELTDVLHAPRGQARDSDPAPRDAAAESDPEI